MSRIVELTALEVQEKSSMTISKDIFRAYDIRGIVDKALTDEAAYLIGLAYGSEVRDQGSNVVVHGRDGRLTSTRLSKKLVEGLLATGCDVIDVGEVPSPVLYYGTHVLSGESGIMLTASHNPPEYNGMKMIINGRTLAGDEIQHLYQRIINQDFVRGQGRYHEEDIVEKYFNQITSSIPVNKKYKIVIDCGNGIAGKIAPELFRRLGCEIIEMYCDVDGTFPNHDPDPSDLKNLEDLIQAVKDEKADMGFAFDGDGDRLYVISKDGELIFPDRILMLYAKDVLKREPGATIVYDVKSTRYLDGVIKEHGGKPLMSRTGHSFIKATIKETGAALAGEMSGHTFFKERWYGFDDGTYSGARLLEILSKENISLEDAVAQFPTSESTPEIKLYVDEDKKFGYVERLTQEADFGDGKINTLDGLRVEFDNGWGLVRVSNTTPCLILRFEADDSKALNGIVNHFKQEMLKIDKALMF
jgi:phosphomannomutase / phosphoglucomutase